MRVSYFFACPESPRLEKVHEFLSFSTVAIQSSAFISPMVTVITIFFRSHKIFVASQAISLYQGRTTSEKNESIILWAFSIDKKYSPFVAFDSGESGAYSHFIKKNYLSAVSHPARLEK